jgi:hypothetical protein
MEGTNVAVATLVILGTVLTVLGLFGGANLPIMAMGLLAIVAAGVLGIADGRRKAGS